MRRDEVYLLDILIATRKALKFVEGIDRKEFEDNEIIQNAVMRPLEIIGEASAKISKEFRKAYPRLCKQRTNSLSSSWSALPP